MSLLADRLLAVHDSLSRAGLAHAFGGAIALAYCTEEPRGTRDLDVNVFAGPDRAAEVLGAMPAGTAIRPADVDRARADGQVRVWWDETPIDVFLDTIDFHRETARGVREVPFEGRTIPVLGCDSLVVFKAMVDRTRDWADIEAVAQAQPAAAAAALSALTRLVGADEAPSRRLRSLLG
jgi:hypothetical protein